MNEELKSDARPNDRLIDLIQTTHKGAATIIRNGQVHDPALKGDAPLVEQILGLWAKASPEERQAIRQGMEDSTPAAAQA